MTAKPYDKNLSPGQQLGVVTKVAFTIGIYVFDEFDDVTASWAFSGFTIAVWQDDRVIASKFPETQDFTSGRIVGKNCPGATCPFWMGISSGSLPGEVRINNLKKVTQMGTTLYVHPDGRMKVEQFGSFELFCNIPPSFHWYPFDRHRLPMDFESISLPSIDGKTGKTLIEMVVNPPEMQNGDGGLKHSLWLIDPVAQTGKKTNFFAMSGNTFYVPFFTLTVQRQTSNYIVKVVCPSMILSSSSFVSYWISPAVAPARVGLCVTLMLAQFALMSSISKELPRVSYMTWLDYFLASGTLLCGLALMFFGVSYNMHNSKDDKDSGPAAAAALDKTLRVLLPVLYFIFVAVSLTCGIGNRHFFPSNATKF